MRIAAQVPFLDPRRSSSSAAAAGATSWRSRCADVSQARLLRAPPADGGAPAPRAAPARRGREGFEAFAERQWRAQSALDLAILPDEALARTLRDIQALLERTGTVMLTCASSTLGTHLLLKMVLARVAPIGADRLAQSLTSGIRDLESARPGIGIMHVAALARREPEARAAIERESTGARRLPDGPTRRALQSFLELYGDRAVREAELSTPRWKEDPRPVLRCCAPRSAATSTRSRARWRGPGRKPTPRWRASSRCSTSWSRRSSGTSSRARRSAARLRERMRAWVTRVLGMLREAVLDADRRLLRRDPELDADWRRSSTPARRSRAAERASS